VAAAAAGAAATTASQVGLSGAASSAGADGSAAAAATGPVQALLQLAATAGSGLDAVDKVCIKTLDAACLLLAVAHAACMKRGKWCEVWRGCANLA
jgi:hypothetical protein